MTDESQQFTCKPQPDKDHEGLNLSILTEAFKSILKIVCFEWFPVQTYIDQNPHCIQMHDQYACPPRRKAPSPTATKKSKIISQRGRMAKGTKHSEGSSDIFVAECQK